MIDHLFMNINTAVSMNSLIHFYSKVQGTECARQDDKMNTLKCKWDEDDTVTTRIVHVKVMIVQRLGPLRKFNRRRFWQFILGTLDPPCWLPAIMHVHTIARYTFGCARQPSQTRTLVPLEAISITGV